MSSSSAPRYVGMQGRGTIALPPDVRRRHHLDEPGAQVELVERDDGVIELRPALPAPAGQRWFWTERWQEREREVDEHVRCGEVTVHGSTETFMQHLDALDAAAGAGRVVEEPSKVTTYAHFLSVMRTAPFDDDLEADIGRIDDLFVKDVVDPW